MTPTEKPRPPGEGGGADQIGTHHRQKVTSAPTDDRFAARGDGRLAPADDRSATQADGRSGRRADGRSADGTDGRRAPRADGRFATRTDGRSGRRAGGRSGRRASYSNMQPAAQRPVWTIHLCPAPGAHPVRAIRSILKISLRSFGMRCVGISVHNRRQRDE